MKNVVWSITGSSGFRAGNEEKFICHLAEKYPNVTGAFADDFLGGGSIPEEKRKLVSDIRRTLDTACRPLSMWLTVYGRDLETCDTSVYGLFDVLTLWSWHYEELNRLPERFERWSGNSHGRKSFSASIFTTIPPASLFRMNT